MHSTQTPWLESDQGPEETAGVHGAAMTVLVQALLTQKKKGYLRSLRSQAEVMAAT